MEGFFYGDRHLISIKGLSDKTISPCPYGFPLHLLVTMGGNDENGCLGAEGFDATGELQAFHAWHI